MKPLFFNLLKGLAVFSLCSAILLLSLCFIAEKTSDPTQYVSVFSNATLFLSAFIGGRATASENSRLLSGLIFGLCATLILFLVSLITSSVDSISAVRMLLTVLLSILGALSKKSRPALRSSAKKRKNIAKRYGAYR